MKSPIALVLVLAVPSLANAGISGTFDAKFTGFNSYGIPEVSLQLDLGCDLTCPGGSAIRYSVAGLVDARYASAPDESAGYVSAGFAESVDPSGSAFEANHLLPTGANLHIIAHSASCRCGGAIGQGGFLDIPSQLVTIPPGIDGDKTSPVGKKFYASTYAAPRGGESVTVTASGAGLNVTQVFVQADFEGSGAAISGTPTEAGTITIVASLSGGAPNTRTIEITPKEAPTTVPTHHSNPKPGTPKGGCSAVPGIFPLAMLLLLRRRS